MVQAQAQENHLSRGSTSLLLTGLPFPPHVYTPSWRREVRRCVFWDCTEGPGRRQTLSPQNMADRAFTSRGSHEPLGSWGEGTAPIEQVLARSPALLHGPAAEASSDAYTVFEVEKML